MRAGSPTQLRHSLTERLMIDRKTSQSELCLGLTSLHLVPVIFRTYLNSAATEASCCFQWSLSKAGYTTSAEFFSSLHFGYVTLASSCLFSVLYSSTTLATFEKEKSHLHMN